VLDIRPPTREDLREGRAKDVDFIQLDITNREAVFKAFQKPWPTVVPGASEPEVTVFHTAATIRFYEKHPRLLHLSEAVNVHGTQNILAAARLTGTRTMIYTSSGSIGVHRSRFWLFPWEKEPAFYTQVINDDTNVPKRHEEFFSNYAVSKLTAEGHVRAADRSPSGDGKILRTGCVRPGNGIYGPGGDLLVGAYMVRKYNPTWISNIMQSFIYVENCSLAHLLYEQRLIELENGSANPDIGGDSFCITDAGAPPTFGDIHHALYLLSGGEVTSSDWSPTAMLSVAHLVEMYYLARRFLAKSSLAFLVNLMPEVNGDIVFLQPSMFALTNVHLHFDDSRARAPPEKGGLGYNTEVTTLRGVSQVVVDHYRNGGKGTARAIAGHAETNQSPLVGAEMAVGTAMGKIGEGMDATKAMN
jgi:nucleoside-diphosphate-sugar epimerase